MQTADLVVSQEHACGHQLDLHLRPRLESALAQAQMCFATVRRQINAADLFHRIEPAVLAFLLRLFPILFVSGAVLLSVANLLARAFGYSIRLWYSFPGVFCPIEHCRHGGRICKSRFDCCAD